MSCRLRLHSLTALMVVALALTCSWRVWAKDTATLIPTGDGHFVRETPWNWEMGWNHLVPSKSTLEDARAKLGEAKLIGSEGSYDIYEFQHDVRVRTLRGLPTIEKIDVGLGAAGVPAWPPFPADKKELLKLYGALPGVTPTYSNEKHKKITKLTFFAMEIIDEDPRAGGEKYPQ